MTFAVQIIRRRVAATPRLRRGYSVETGESRRRPGCDADIPPRLVRTSGTRRRPGARVAPSKKSKRSHDATCRGRARHHLGASLS